MIFVVVDLSLAVYRLGVFFVICFLSLTTGFAFAGDLQVATFLPGYGSFRQTFIGLFNYEAIGVIEKFLSFETPWPSRSSFGMGREEFCVLG